MRWRRCDRGSPRAAEAAGRNVGEIELLPITKFFPATDVAILSRLGCRSVGESREQEASAKVAELARLLAASPDTGSREMQWHMVGRIQRKKARSLARWAHTAHSIDSPQLVTALDRAVTRCTGRAPTQRTAAGLRSGQPRRRRVTRRRRHIDVRAASGAVDKICAQVEESESLELVGLMGIPPLDWEPEQAFDRLQSEHRRVLRVAPERRRPVGRHVQRPGNRRQTWFDVCACRYRAIGSAAVTVTVNSHS